MDTLNRLQLTDSTNMADAFMLGPIVWAFSVTLGPMMGGFLAEPAKSWPNVFGKAPFLVNHPFFLPCFVAGMYAFSAFVVPLFGLREPQTRISQLPLPLRHPSSIPH
ncbi:hypothetical protein L218DRAFT_665918 [Marasmius fiardii PR-910]|nr:hypothetical protein L218DRAFT_665918 [Marasmius fiardii PR-910]